MATRAEVSAVLNYLCAAYGTQVDEKQLAAWATTFRDVPRLWMARVATAWVENAKWFPKISELRFKVSTEMRNSYWQPPKRVRDEACMWLLFRRGIGTSELTQADLDKLPAEVDIDVTAPLREGA